MFATIGATCQLDRPVIGELLKTCPADRLVASDLAPPAITRIEERLAQLTAKR